MVIANDDLFFVMCLFIMAVVRGVKTSEDPIFSRLREARGRFQSGMLYSMSVWYVWYQFSLLNLQHCENHLLNRGEDGVQIPTADGHMRGQLMEDEMED